MTINNRALSVAGAILALGTLFLASAWSKDLPIQIKVLSGETRQFQGPPFPPVNCAYCSNSSPETYVEHTMVIQEAGGKSLEIACTVYNQWSRCTNLPVNQSFQAWMGKRSLKIRYLDQSGKMREQVYEINKVDITAQP